ncbi:DUF4190 domain-containing protein [Glycomyces salinus]|uniref:DUF4190 domain-containing protein n=1 Tax=Glycomyces salinus TaxID=980294 RepID=UPI0018EC2DDF|nr:DUF4190 domain-containing protein [Glycomyces salinus]
MSSPDPGPDPQQPPPPYPPQVYGYQYPPPRRPVNGMAIAAMVLGIVGVCSPVGLLGLIFGTIARRQIAERGEDGDGFAVTGVVLGWIAVAATVFWIIYLIFWVWAVGRAVDEFNDPSNWPSSDPSFSFY